MKLEELLKKIEPLPWRHQGILIEGTKAVSPFMPPLIATVDRSFDRGPLTPEDEQHAAYLVHAANVLPEVVRAAIQVINDYETAGCEDCGTISQHAHDMLRTALAKAEEVDV